MVVGLSLRSLCRSFSFAPSGLVLIPLSTQGLRPGLHSCAASRLNSGPFSPPFASPSGYDTNSSGTLFQFSRAYPGLPSLRQAQAGSGLSYAAPPGLEWDGAGGAGRRHQGSPESTATAKARSKAADRSVRSTRAVKGSGQECPLHTNCHPEIGECPVCMVRLGILVNGKEYVILSDNPSRQGCV